MTSQNFGRRVFLIGFMGAGKTTVGRRLGRRLGCSFYDLDEVIEHSEQKTIAQIFDQSGETEFRQIESTALIELLERSENGCVIALGGGAFAQPENRRVLERSGGITVMLSAPVEELQRRCEAAGSGRPLARDKDSFQRLFSARQQAYALAEFRVDTSNKEIDEVAEEIVTILKIGN